MAKVTRRFTVLTLFVLLLVGCRSESGQMPKWLADLLGVSPNVQVPATRELQPTPTLVVDGQALDEAPARPTSALRVTATPAATEESEGAQEAAPAEQESGPFTGTFAGTVEGDQNSSATLELDLTQSGAQVDGTVMLGEGLVVNAGGLCGSIPIPALNLSASDDVDGRVLSTSTEVEVSGFKVPIELNATLSADGDTIQARATMYPPSLCGNEPTVTATLERVGG